MSIRRKNLYESLYIDFKDLIVEYGSDTDVYDLVDEYNGQLFIDGEIDTNKVGDYDITFTVSQREDRYNTLVTRKYDEIVRVIDTKAPIIELLKDEVSVYVGNDYDPKDNIVRIYDEVDGDISDFDIISDLDTTAVGEYEVKIISGDRNGLTTDKKYKISVRNKVLSATEGYDLIYHYLTGIYGYNRAAACGILANIRYESTFNPDVGDYYYGLCQWGASRKDNLFSYCDSNGLDSSSIEGQLSFMDYELNNYYSSVKKYLLSVDNDSLGAYSAADYFCRNYEGAASADGRGELASEYFNS